MRKLTALALSVLLMLGAFCLPLAAEEETFLIWDGREKVELHVNGETADLVTADGALGTDGIKEWVWINDSTENLSFADASFVRYFTLYEKLKPYVPELCGLEFDIWVSDASFGDMEFMAEVSSAAIWDKLEREGAHRFNHLFNTTLEAGKWQTVRLSFDRLNGADSGFVPKNFDFFRVWNVKVATPIVFENGLTVAIRNVKGVRGAAQSGGATGEGVEGALTMESGVNSSALVTIPTESNPENKAVRFLNFKAGDAVRTASHAVQYVLSTPMDISGMSTMCFDLYLQGYEYAKDFKFEIELTSAGQCDNQEIKMVNVTLNAISNVTLKDGWNHVEMPLAYFAGTTEGTAVPGAFDPTKWNFMRTYICGGIGDGVAKGDIVAAIDNVYFTAAEDTPSTPDVPSGEEEPAAEGEIRLDSCDSTDGWGGAVRINVKDKQQGVGCIEFLSKGGFVVTDSFAPVNAAGAQTLCLDLYVSSAELIYSGSALHLEMTSAGTYDKEETGWDLSSVDIVDGWNHLVLPLKSASTGCDLTRVNFLRLYALGLPADQELTVRLDNIRLSTLVPEGEEIDLGQHILGRKDEHVAKPVEKEITVNGPYDPWGTSDADGAGDAVVGDETPDEVTEREMPLVAIILMAAGGADLLIGLFICFVKKNKKMGGALSALGAAALIVGVVLLFVLPTGEATDEAPAEDAPSSDSALPTVLTTDQTGHPENSAAEVDVEALLKVDKDYDYREDYKVFYRDSSILESTDGQPRVTLREGGTVEEGLSLSIKDGAVPDYFLMKEKDSWMLEAWNGTNKLYLRADDATAAAYEGNKIALNFLVYLIQQAEITVRYMDTAGVEQTASVSCDRAKQWTLMSVTLENVAFGGGVDGYDLYVHATATDGTVRLNQVYIRDWKDDSKDIQTGLIHSEFETDSYTVADVNVLSFGAQGNGVSDDTDAFREAIERVRQMGGGTVFVPAGYYCLTETLTLPQGVGLVGELEQGTARGTVLCIYGGKGETALTKSAIIMYSQSAVINMAFWYPEQTLVNGTAIPYPPTMTQDQPESVTIRNVTLVNSYTGIHFGKNGNNSLQYVRDVYGTCLELGYINNLSLDIGRVEYLTLTPDIWLSSGLPGTPNATLLRTYMLRHSVGMQMQRIDWTYYENIEIEGYRVGMLFNTSEAGMTNGHMYNVRLLDCYDCIRAENLNWLIATGCTLRAAGGNGAAAVRVLEDCIGEMSFVNCSLTSSGANALLNYGKMEFALMDCELTSDGKSTYVNLGAKNETLINTTLSSNIDNKTILTLTDVPTLKTDVDYARTVVTKPASEAYVNITEAPYHAKADEDVTAILQKAIDDMKETGGTVYVPAGTYILSAPITVHAGVEVRGAVPWPQKQDKTKFLTDVGENDPDGEALFTLYDGAGLRGFGVVYSNMTTYHLHPYSYAVRGNGKNIYVVSLSLGNCWQMIDFGTYRCDNHYVEYLQGVPLLTGVYVGGGSEGGIVRDCQITPNTWKGYTPENTGRVEWNIVYDLIMEQCSPYKIGESRGEVLYHNFVYGAWRGLDVLDGAKDVFVLGHGVDGANVSAHFSGDCTVTMVDSQLVNLFHTGKDGILHYLITDETFSGELTLINSSFWGPTKQAWELNGTGDVTMYGVQMHVAGSPMCELNGGTLSLYGMLEMVRGTDFVIGKGADALTLSGNVFPGGLQIDSDANDHVVIAGEDVKK